MKQWLEQVSVNEITYELPLRGDSVNETEELLCLNTSHGVDQRFLFIKRQTDHDNSEGNVVSGKASVAGHFIGARSNSVYIYSRSNCILVLSLEHR